MKIIQALLFTILLSLPVYAQEEKLVEIPIRYSEWENPMKTSACVGIKEKIYAPEVSDWKNFTNMTQGGPEKALIETITAMQKKDGPRLKELSDPEFVRDAKFEEQASAYFSQLGVMQIESIRSYMKFDDLIVFYALLKYKDKSFYAPFPFTCDKNGKFCFLPPYEMQMKNSDSNKNNNGKSIILQLADDWYNSDWGPAKSQSPSYCDPSLINKMTHEVVLEDANHSDSAAKLLLVGNKLDKNGPYADLFAQITNMQEVLKQNRMDEYFGGFTELGKKENRDWFLVETEERLHTQHIENFEAQQPFYVFDTDPLFVVYLRTKSAGVQALYFMRQGDHQFKLADESVGSPFDRIFKSKRFIDAANDEKPFDRWRILNKRDPLKN